MTHLSTASSFSQMNKMMQNLLSNLPLLQNRQTANLIGKSVIVPGNVITLRAGKGELGFLSESAADNLEVTIADASGEVINTLKFFDVPAGISSISWDGKVGNGETAPDGEYTFDVMANSRGMQINAFPLSVGLVESVSAGLAGDDSGVILNIPVLGPVCLANVLEILEEK